MVDVRREDEVWWAVATRFQADRDLIVVPRLPGSLLDPSSDEGVTARMGLDATRGAIDGPRVTIRDEAFRRAEDLLGEGGPAAHRPPAFPAVER